MMLSVIAAVANNGVIGLDNTLPWHLPEDLKRFKALTMGHHILMGRKTYESLGRLLPGRTTVVISRNPQYQVTGALVAGSLQQALALCGEDEEVFVIGGNELYKAALPLADKLYLTRIHQDFSGDTYFPSIDETKWREVESLSATSAAGLTYSFNTYIKS
ncbi:MAG: dihydrofolate reductase [Methylophilales bacterium]|nr:dihydrofolate reductase [Methylophilales bacterium]